MTNNTAWSHLPNAAHIDRVLESVKSHPEVWGVPRDIAWGALPRRAAFDAAWNAARIAARIAYWGEARIAARIAYWGEARGAILALIAYDDAAKYLDMPSDKLRVWAVLRKDPAAVLLLPAVIAYEKIDELELV